jgi:5'(3')-deoxyribonucleotidase
MRLGIDLDGVVADFNSGWMRRYNAEFETSLTPDLVVSWDSIPNLTHFADMDEFWLWAEGGPDRDGLFRHLPTFPDALPTLDGLAAAGHQVVILTTKPPWAVHDTFAWLAEQRVPTNEVHILEAKWSVACDVYLDDAPFQVEELVDRRPEATVCRYVRPWNTPIAGAEDVVSWPDFERVIRQLGVGRFPA